MASASGTPPNLPPNVSKANICIIPGTIFYASAVFFYGIRMNDRRRRRNLRLDDLFLTAAIVGNVQFDGSAITEIFQVMPDSILHPWYNIDITWYRTTCVLRESGQFSSDNPFFILRRRVLRLLIYVYEAIDWSNAETLHAGCQ